MVRRITLAAAAVAFVAMPFAGTSHAGCTSDLLNTPRPPDPHSITATYYQAVQQFIACAV
ncbi:MAG TPA: hypothetical protein VFQ85_03525 [Mycobacteriales bacterium]|jgi:hypothetical protein|nr:hypothetical protein [Mycobacteriales bacterium]